VVAAYGGWRWTAVSVHPQQVTWRVERDSTISYVKAAAVGNYPTLRAEAERLGWAAAHLPVPVVLDVGGDGTIDWLVTAAVDGCPASDPTLGDARSVVGQGTAAVP
jgi:aminoglycoside phosphotransferase